MADYLIQHISTVRRVESPPEQLWTTLADYVHNRDDLRRLARAAILRLRYGYAARALRTLYQTGDLSAASELVTLLRRQDRLDEAASLVDDWLAADAKDRRSRVVRAELVRVRARAEQLRRQAADEPHAVELLAELLADGGQADALRARAAAGDVVAAEDLADLLVARGCLDELRHRANSGHSYTADRLADLLASLGRAGELQRRADAGDPAAPIYLARLHKRNEDPGPDGDELARLRSDSDNGDANAATELTTLLFDAGHPEALLDEVNAGTYLAAERYLALLTADPTVDRGQLRRLRAFGLAADGFSDEAAAATCQPTTLIERPA